MLGVDKRDLSAHFLRGSGDVQRHGRFAGGLRSVDLNNTPTRNAADAQRDIQRQRARRNRLHIQRAVFAKAHDRAFSKLLFELREGCLQCFCLIHMFCPFLSAHVPGRKTRFARCIYSIQ